MPTTNRVGWVKAKTQRDFRKYKDLTDEKEIDLYLIVGETNLDSVEIQAAHLTKMFNTDWDAEANRAFQPPPGHDELPDPADVPPRRNEKEEDAERS